jgi:hypothetical protein
MKHNIYLVSRLHEPNLKGKPKFDQSGFITIVDNDGSQKGQKMIIGNRIENHVLFTRANI